MALKRSISARPSSHSPLSDSSEPRLSHSADSLARPVSLAAYLPYPLKTDSNRAEHALGPVPPDIAIRFELALIRALEAVRCEVLYAVSLVVADEMLRRLDSRYLYVIGVSLVTEAKVDNLHGAALTKFHLFAMCVADHLVARGSTLP